MVIYEKQYLEMLQSTDKINNERLLKGKIELYKGEHYLDKELKVRFVEKDTKFPGNEKIFVILDTDELCDKLGIKSTKDISDCIATVESNKLLLSVSKPNLTCILFVTYMFKKYKLKWSNKKWETVLAQ